MLPQLADLDVERLSAESQDALAAAQEIYVDGRPAEDVARARGLSVPELTLRIEKLGTEWREHAGQRALPRLAQEEYEALRDSIARYGLQYPILVDAAGNVIDGRHRLRACLELGVEPRYEQLPANIDPEDYQDLALAVELARRHLTASARRGIIREELVRDPSRSDRTIALAIGTTHPTVASVRRELEQDGAVERLSTRTDAAGRTQPASKPPRDPQPETELPDGLVDVTLRLAREYAAQLDGGGWLDCRSIRLVLVAAGTYTLEVRQ